MYEKNLTNLFSNFKAIHIIRLIKHRTVARPVGLRVGSPVANAAIRTSGIQATHVGIKISVLFSYFVLNTRINAPTAK